MTRGISFQFPLHVVENKQMLLSCKAFYRRSILVDIITLMRPIMDLSRIWPVILKLRISSGCENPERPVLRQLWKFPVCRPPNDSALTQLFAFGPSPVSSKKFLFATSEPPGFDTSFRDRPHLGGKQPPITSYHSPRPRLLRLSRSTEIFSPVPHLPKPICIGGVLPNDHRPHVA